MEGGSGGKLGGAGKGLGGLVAVGGGCSRTVRGQGGGRGGGGAQLVRTGVIPCEISSLFHRTDQQQGPRHGQPSSHTLTASAEEVCIWELTRLLGPTASPRAQPGLGELEEWR